MTRLSIGEFAQESGLTPKALRLYDELGLLPPVHVDPRTGYRSYEPSQLDRAQLIVRLRVLGMPLERIRMVVDLPPRAAAAEITSYWRQVEADTAARQEMVAFLIDHFSRKDTDMVDVAAEFEVRSAGRADGGLVRRSNEDAVFAGQRLFAVADGFGAQGLDRTASTAALEALEPLDSHHPDGQDPLEVLAGAAGRARAAVHEFTRSDASRDGAGTTLTAMLRVGDRFAVVHVGDTRAYLLRGGELTQITHDHTFVQSLVDEGKLTPEEAASHPQRADLQRALHRDDTAQPDLHLRETQVGDRYLLCSDGLHTAIGEQELARVLTTASTPQHAVDRCVELVHAAGAPDNVACLVVDAVTDE